MGQQRIKNIAEPVEAWRVVFEGEVQDGPFAAAVAASRFTAAKGQTLDLIAPAGVRAPRVVLVGGGKRDEFDALGAEYPHGLELAGLDVRHHRRRIRDQRESLSRVRARLRLLLCPPHPRVSRLFRGHRFRVAHYGENGCTEIARS